MSTHGPLGIVVLAHAYPEQLGLLLSELRHPHVRCYVHLDARTDRLPFDEALADLEPEAYRWLPRHPSRWGGPEAVDASLEGIAAAVDDGCHHVLQISGQDLPLLPIDRIVDFFQNNRGRSFVDHFPLPGDRWQHGGMLRIERYSFDVFGRRIIHLPRGMEASLRWKRRLLNTALGLAVSIRPKRKFPSYVQPHGGSSWWNLDREAAAWILEFVAAHPDYRRYHQHTHCTDEIFFQSIVGGTEFAEWHEIVNDSLRYIRWERGAYHPNMITVKQFPELLGARVPFGRKFDLATARLFLAWRERVSTPSRMGDLADSSTAYGRVAAGASRG